MSALVDRGDLPGVNVKQQNPDSRRSSPARRKRTILTINLRSQLAAFIRRNRSIAFLSRAGFNCAAYFLDRPDGHSCAFGWTLNDPRKLKRFTAFHRDAASAIARDARAAERNVTHAM